MHAWVKKKLVKPDACGEGARQPDALRRERDPEVETTYDGQRRDQRRKGGHPPGERAVWTRPNDVIRVPERRRHASHDAGSERRERHFQCVQIGWPVSCLIPLVQFDEVARRVDQGRLVSEALPVRDVVHSVSMRAN